MGFNRVYKSLQELFPQIDARLLRAVAIEHSKDADAAVEAVLEEIIPFFTERSRPSSPLKDTSEAVSSAVPELGHDRKADGGASQFLNDADDVNGGSFYDACDGHHDGENNVAKLTLLDNDLESSVELSADSYSPGETVVLVDQIEPRTQQIQVPGDSETEGLSSADKCLESCKSTSSEDIHHVHETIQNENLGIYGSTNPSQENEGFDDHKRIDFSVDTNQENALEKSSGNNQTPFSDAASLATHDPTLNCSAGNVELLALPDMDVSNLGDAKESLSSDTASKMDDASNIIANEEESSSNANLSQSRQIEITDVLEEVIAEARNNKKTLFSAMESVIGLMKEVESKELAAEQAKEEAARGGADILDKVEELKEMLQRAKAANDMHAGEVYGEKAILATELRELQARVLSLSDERDNSLAVLDEMQQTLEGRLAAAEDEIRSAQQERLQKEQIASKALAIQEMVMEKVVQEAHILKQQAEENAKLQEFLVDRGRVVDMLQGEIAVICKDVRDLKQKFDDHVPFSKSLSSSQTSCILASSASSLKSLMTDQVEAAPDQTESLDTQKEDLFSSEEHVPEDEVTKDDALMDDGWELFDNNDLEAIRA